VFCNEEKLNVTELLERSRRFFLHDVEVDGELSSTSAWTPKKHSFQRWAGRIIQELCSTARLTQKMFTYFTCTNILKSSEPSTAVILKHALKRARIESFHWDIKSVLGFEDYRFRESDAAIIHSHLVSPPGAQSSADPEQEGGETRVRAKTAAIPQHRGRRETNQGQMPRSGVQMVPRQNLGRTNHSKYTRNDQSTNTNLQISS
jgi:hypothetical protein